MIISKIAKHTFASLAAVISAFAPSAFAYNASTDFSHTANPNGVWKYGSEYPAGTFNLINSGTAGQVNSNPDVWFWQGGAGYIGEPTVGKNIGTSSWYPGGGSTTYQPGDFGLHPGPIGERAVVRWTAPSNGTYQVTASFKGGDPSTSSDAKISKAGTQLWSATVS